MRSVNDVGVFEKKPSVETLQDQGKFLGYDQYNEVYLFKNKKYVLLDYLDKRKKLCYHVERWYGNVEDLYVGFKDDESGNPITVTDLMNSSY